MKQGASHARNRGASEASFEHLVYLDDDDWSMKVGWKRLLLYKLRFDPIVLSVLLNLGSNRCLPNG